MSNKEDCLEILKRSSEPFELLDLLSRYSDYMWADQVTSFLFGGDPEDAEEILARVKEIFE